MENKIIGTNIGLYDVFYECDFKSNDGHKMYHVRCRECGWEGNMQGRHIKRAVSCHHLNKHGMYKQFNLYCWENERIASIFNGMKDRCYNQNCKDYKRYGAKGIKICDEWIENPKLFEEWSLLNGYEEHLTIDRIEEDKNYCPENCQWAEREENTRYKSTTSYLYVNGEVHTGREWSGILGFGPNRINTYVRTYGKENTEEFIRRYLENPGIKPKGAQSYYDLYML